MIVILVPLPFAIDDGEGKSQLAGGQDDREWQRMRRRGCEAFLLPAAEAQQTERLCGLWLGPSPPSSRPRVSPSSPWATTCRTVRIDKGLPPLQDCYRNPAPAQRR